MNVWQESGVDMDGVLTELEAIEGSSVLTDRAAIVGYATDWTGRWTGEPAAVVRPRTVAAMAAVLSCCYRHRVPVVPQGGNTGLVAGCWAPRGSVIVSTRFLTDVGTIDEESALVVGAGVTLAELEVAAAEHGYTGGLMLASGESATVGGAVATNAGGARVLRYGTARNRVLGVRAVTMSGAVIDRLHQLPKDNTGLDLTSLLIGSEGTLAVITDLRWKLDPAVDELIVVVFSFPTVTQAVDALAQLRALPGLRALEWAAGKDVDRVARHIETPPPLPTDGVWVFAELGDEAVPAHSGDTAQLIERAEPVIDALSTLMPDDNRIVAGVTVPERRRLWAFRERLTEAVNAAGVPVKLDVGVPMSSFSRVCESIHTVVEEIVPGTEVVLFGHLAEGNLHVNLLPPARGRKFTPDEAHGLERAVLELVLDVGGTVSAEHGVGRAKRDWLERQRGTTQVALMRAVKQAWDPERLLNPGAVF